MMNDGQPATYMAHDGKLYQWPPPPLWWQGSNGRWFPPTETHLAQLAPPKKQRSMGRQILIFGGAVLGFLLILPIIGGMIEASDSGGATTSRGSDVFEELLVPYENLGCEGEADRSKLRLYYDDRASNGSRCQNGVILTIAALGIDWQTNDDEPFGGVFGTHYGRDYKMNVTLDSRDGIDNIKTAFTFTQR